jgi:hypothetical protein
MAHELLKISEDLPLLRRPVIEFGKITPHGFLGGIGRVGGMR